MSNQNQKQRVLVIDDDPDSAEVMCFMLAQSDCETRVAHVFGDALQAARELKPEVALIDIGLPDVDGHELLNALRADPALTHCRFIAVTGHSRVDLERRGKIAGFDAYLRKPVALEVLKDAVHGSTLIDSHSAC